MKKLISICVVVGMFFSMLVACQTNTDSFQDNSLSDKSAQTLKNANTTLMIYMVGSDLEPKSGSATADLQEIEKSGIDLAYNKVVVCAGGTPYWNNDKLSAECINILSLQDSGFVPVNTQENTSMGTAEQLTRFLDYCWNNYQNDEFALILWDHGNGPVMGYGKDIVHGDDALLLTEIKTALRSSAFSDKNKLSWVGFDACLMASAELSCIMADHADYLIASQEIEPAFGWDYSFLSQLGKVATPQLLKLITDYYMVECKSYYTKRNYDNYDVTLSVVDLSHASELENAINKLFSAASKEVDHYYDLLAKNRAETHALGRATTGSEYDLVDIKDMAKQLSSQYPKLVNDLLGVIDHMVMINETSLGSCCGMSLYYPFFNKKYYEKDWKRIYSELGLFQEYQVYLANYEQTWLKEDKLDKVTLGMIPEQTDNVTFSVTLDDEQAKTYGSAVYYILKRESGDIYRQVFTSKDVVFENNVLKAEYDGMAIYVCSDGMEPFLPPLTAIDQIDRLYRYAGMFQLSNLTYKPSDIADEDLPQEVYDHWRYLLTLNSETGKVEMSGTVPYFDSSMEDLVQSGRIAEADLSKYGAIEFIYAQSRYVTRYDNGVIKPLNQWYSTESTTYNSIPLARGYSFEYAPLANGEYYLMFEIADTQNASYCSELLPISVENSTSEETNLVVTESVWEDGADRVLLKSQDGVKLYLTTKDTVYDGTRYFIEAENANDFKITVSGKMLANGRLHTGSFNFDVKSYDFMYEELEFGISEATGDLDNLLTLQIQLTIENERTGELVWPFQFLNADMTFAPKIDFDKTYKQKVIFDAPYKGALGQKQVIYESEDVRLTLMGIGKYSETDSSANPIYIFAENLSDKPLDIALLGYEINGCFFSDVEYSNWLAPGEQKYICLYLDDSELEKWGIQEINSMTISAAFSPKEIWRTESFDCLWCAINLDQHGKYQTFDLGDVLWEEQGVRVYISKTYVDEKKWDIIIENNSDEDICLAVTETYFDGVRCYNGIYTSNCCLGQNQLTIGAIKIDSDWCDVPLLENVEFKFQIMTFDETEILFTASQTTLLTIE